jgi:4-amino-4-deoxy-L-arabinose transferase-like glycosyltransferase
MSLSARTRDWSPPSLVVALILACAVLRGALGSVIGPSVDESYAVVMGRHLQLSYYDHPPLTFWMAGLAARLFRSEQALAVRFPFILGFMATSWLLYRLATFLFGARAGLWTVVLLNLVLFFTLAVGTWVLPDGPLLLSSAAAALCLARATLVPLPEDARAAVRAVEAADRHVDRPRGYAWLGVGLSCGLALLSKYHGLFLVAGALLFLLTSAPHRFWLRRPEPYVAAAVALVVFTPVIAWNAGHDWASFRFQAGRAVPAEESQGTPFLDTILGQAAWILPWIWIPLVAAFVVALRRGPRDARRWLLACLALGPVVGFTALTALGSRGLPHWQAPGYFLLLPLLGASVAARLGRGERSTRIWVWGSVAGSALVLAALVTHVSNGWISRVAPRLLARGDPTDDLLPWRDLEARLRDWGYPQAAVVTAGASWADAAKVAYALGPAVPVTCVGADPRGFQFTTAQSALVGRDVLLIARRRPGPEPMVTYAPYFDHILPLGTFAVSHGPQEAFQVSVYLGARLRAPVPPRRPL